MYDLAPVLVDKPYPGLPRAPGGTVIFGLSQNGGMQFGETGKRQEVLVTHPAEQAHESLQASCGRCLGLNLPRGTGFLVIQIQFHSFLEIRGAVLPGVIPPYGVVFNSVKQCRVLEYLRTEQRRSQEVVPDAVLPVQVPTFHSELQPGVGCIHVPLLRVRRQRYVLTRYERVQKGQSSMKWANPRLGGVHQELGDVHLVGQGLQHARLDSLVSQGETQVVQ